MRLFLLQLSVTIAAMPFILASPGPISVDALIVCIALAAFSISIHMFARVTDKQIPFAVLSPDMLFLMGYSVVHFAIPIALIFGVVAESDFEWKLQSDQYLNQAVGYAVLGIATFSIGYNALRNSTLMTSVVCYHNRLLAYETLSASVFFNVLGTILWCFFFIRNYAEYLNANYVGMSVTSMVDLLAFDFACIFLALSSTGLLICYCRNQVSLTALLCSLIPHSTLVMAVLIHGDRGTLVAFSIPFLSGCFFLKLINKRMLFAVGCCGFLVMQAIYTYRDGERGLSTLLSSTTYDLSAAVETQTINFGKSGLLVPLSLSYTEEHGNASGFFSLSGMCQAIPFLQGWLLRTFFTDREYEFSSYTLFTYLIHGKFATSGAGTTTVAEAILDWGILSVCYTHAVLGVCASYIVSLMYSKRNVAGDSFYFYANGVFIIMGRYGAASTIARSILLVGLVHVLVSVLLARVSRERRIDE